MKKFFIPIGFTLLVIVLFNSCKKDDTTAPVILLKGSTESTQSLPSTSGGGSWSDPGYSANDDKDGDLTSSVSVSGSVNPNKKGDYKITYSVSDKAGNNQQVVRTIHIVNDAEVFAGAYNNSVDSCVTTLPSAFNASVTASDSINNLIWINNFGSFGTNINIKATITSTTIDVPTGQNLGGIATITDFYSGNSQVVSATTPTKFIVSYKWSDGVSNDVCKGWYIR